MAMIVESVFCLGCGGDLAGRSTDRRDLRFTLTFETLSKMGMEDVY